MGGMMKVVRWLIEEHDDSSYVAVEMDDGERYLSDGDIWFDSEGREVRDERHYDLHEAWDKVGRGLLSHGFAQAARANLLKHMLGLDTP